MEPAGPEASLSIELVHRIQAGDEDAWETLYLRYRDPLLFSIRQRLGPKLRSKLQSEDVLHSFIKDAMQDLAEFEPRGPGALDHWLHVCVLNKIRAKGSRKNKFMDLAPRFGSDLATTIERNRRRSPATLRPLC